MKITALEIDGYGMWSGLRIERLADGLNVVYGPNEAGKIDSACSSSARCSTASRPSGGDISRRVHGGRPGGWIEVAGPNGRFQIDRHDEPRAGGPAARRSS